MSWIYNALLGTGPQQVQVGPARSVSPAAPPSEKPPPYTDTVPSASRLPLGLPALQLLRTERVILASASPRRKAILSLLGLPNIEVIPSTFPEDLSKTDHSPWDYVLQTAVAKCMEVYVRTTSNADEKEPALVLAADTVIVTALGEILEKPANEQAHFNMLKKLRDGMPHKVYTAVVVMSPLESLLHPGYSQEQIVEETKVVFDKFVSDELLWGYVRTREGCDKAGGYALQGLGSVLVDRIEGSADNVVGLPLKATLKAIEKCLSTDVLEEDEDEVTLL